MIPLDAAPSGHRRSDLHLTPAAAVNLIADGATVAVGGTGSLLQVPETLLTALEQRWETDHGPAGLDVVHVMGLGDHEGRGIDHIAIPGLVRRFIGSHFVLSPRQQALIAGNEVEAIGLPAGTISLLYREIAARRPGLFTDIGLGTFVDPRQQWGRMNSRTPEGLSELVTLRGQEWLFYPGFDLDVALLRATEADVDGNIGMDDEAAIGDNLALAQAAHNSGGLVIVEVKRLVDRGEIPAGRVRIPGPLVDHVVLTGYPKQTPVTVDDPRRTGTVPNQPTEVEPLPFDERKVVARRAAVELCEGDLANLGVGMANGISYVALEEGFLDRFTLTVEQGIFGGLPGVGLDSGTAINPSAIVDMPGQFDLYDGGGLDFAGLAFAEIDRRGNVNVAAAGGKPIGPGGFIDISQKARTIVFCGTLRGGGLQVRLDDGKLAITTDGRYPKFVPEVSHISFNAERACRRGQRVLYVTERAVFRLTGEGVELVEIAPGVDLHRDVLDRMGFAPVLRTEPRLMDPRLFRAGPAGLKPRPRRDTERPHHS
ncbi:acyl CoA:acetate/3-ketoacid CoA transferase [Amycolatopsis endophytica]|uniref:Propionate CoA-transferase n=1 Tax=Amycolatopsis endophytica TaxID=860233 RepID=A0A853BA22_9PSEU|nr:CoA-transferase [Amycolatopsis endophytica]NYI91624.1 propionate CoA-transferase [Amycolatopsis endophytica]